MRTSVKKLEMANEAVRSGNVSVTDKSYIVQPSQIRRWQKNYKKINKFVEKSTTHVTIHPGRKLEN